MIAANKKKKGYTFSPLLHILCDSCKKGGYTVFIMKMNNISQTHEYKP